MDTMLRADAASARGASFARLPRAALQPGALVVAFSPLLDQRFVESLRDLRERGFTLLVVDVLNVAPPTRRLGLPGGPDALARKLWQMEQQGIPFSLRGLGVPVAPRARGAGLDLPSGPPHPL